MSKNAKVTSQARGQKVRAIALMFAMAAQLVVSVPVRAQLPELGDGMEMSSSAERRLGDRIARELYRDPDFIDDAILGEYVQGIWMRLLAAARQGGELPPELEERFAWTVLLGKEHSVNAFALPGGYLGVHLGLIAVVNSEDELASVLAHELSHVTQRHIARIISRQNKQSPLLLGAMILGVLAASRNPEAAGAVVAGGQAASIQGQLNFSRDMEREADRIGYRVSTQAGFNPGGFVSMFEKLQQANRFNDTGAFPYLRSHPLTTERIADMQARQQLLVRTLKPKLQMAHAMLAARARMLANSEVDSLRAALKQANGETYATMRPAEQAGILYAAVMAASGLREFAQAKRMQQRLMSVARGDANAEKQAQLLGIEVALADGDAGHASKLLDAEILTAGQTRSRPVEMLRAQVWTKSGQARQAAEALQVWVAGQPRDAKAWQQLSDAYAAQGQTLRSIRAEAESHAARLDFAAAKDRLQAAQEFVRKGKSVDHIEASIIDARTRQIDLLLREQALER